MREELSTRELPLQSAPVLSPAEVAGISPRYLGTVRQPVSEPGQGTSARGTDLPSRRLFNVFEMIVTPAVLEKMRNAPAVTMFTEEEVATTNGGRTKGEAHDGTAIADNIFLV
jgi:hypothetical protein